MGGLSGQVDAHRSEQGVSGRFMTRSATGSCGADRHRRRNARPAHRSWSAEPVAPRQDTPCPENLSGALTQLPDQKTILQCQIARRRTSVARSSIPVPQQRSLADLRPSADAARRRTAQSRDRFRRVDCRTRRNPTADAEARQRAVIAAGTLSPAQTSTGKPGQPMTFRMLPLLFTVELRGRLPLAEGAIPRFPEGPPKRRVVA